MAELLHYLDKMEYRPTAKPKEPVVLKRRPAQEVTIQEDLLLDIFDKRRVSGFKRIIVKDFERMVGTVQERKKRKEGEMPAPAIYLEVTEMETATDVDVPLVKITEGDEDEYLKEPVTPEDVSFKLGERLEELAEEEPETPEDKSRELSARLKELEEMEPAPKPTEKEPATKPTEKEVAAPKKRVTKKKLADLGKMITGKTAVTNATEINGQRVLERVPKQKDLSELVMRVSSYYMSNRKLYSEQLTELFKDFRKELLDDKSPVSCDRQGSTKNIDLLIHQRIVREYLNLYTPYRGLLLYHGLGSGKTCTSIAIAEAAKTHKRIFIMTPASLKTNFFSELKKCGDSLYKKNQFWEFISIDGRPEYVSVLSQILSMDPKTILKNGGAWLVDIKKTEPNFSELSPEEQRSLDEQLDEMIRAKYVDINYNGLNERKFKELVKTYADPVTKNPFDHSVVLVDEAHNLVSRIVNNLKKGATITSKLYEYLQSAQDVRIVFMSGTPVINYPHEMGVMFNILRGYINSWKFTISSAGKTKLSAENIVKMFRSANFNTFDYIDYSNETLTITRNPFGFVNSYSNETGKKSALPHVVGRTTVRGGNATKEPDVEEEDVEEEKEEKKTMRMSVKKRRNVKGKRATKRVSSDKIKQSSDKTKQSSDEIKQSSDEIIPTSTYKYTKGALELNPDIPVDLPDSVLKDIEDEIHLDINAAGEDNYHSGGTIVVDNKYQGVRLDEQGNLSDVDFEHRVKQILTDNEITFLPKVVVTKNKCLPDAQKEFQNIFVDMDSLTLQRPDVLKKRILGLTSYFRSAQESLLPQFVLSTNPLNPNYHIEYVEMSDYQLNDYAAERMAELERESRPKKQTKAAQNEELLKTSGSYRTFTRAKCNFSFPEEIPRPTPPNIFDEKHALRAEELDNILDDNELDAEPNMDVAKAKANASVKETGEYEKQIQRALADLKAAGDRYLTPTALQKYSPKFAKILANIQDPENRGLHLIYSSFRTLEGVGILKLVLEANGFAEFKLKKVGDVWSIKEHDDAADATKPKFVLYTGTETAEEKEIIRNIYNSNWEFVPGNITAKLRETHENNFYGELIRMIMITSSGAEGINLENTRFVHIVEPYWHMVRIDQVVGRARRICSHKNLPEDMRTIKVFLYMSKFSSKQKTDGKNVGIMIADVSRINTPPAGAKTGEYSITTDETLFEIAVIKDRLTKQLLKSVKESSVDCKVYDNSKEGLACYTYGYTTSKEFGAFPTYEEDRYVREGTDVAVKEVAIDKLVIGKKTYAHNTQTDELYNYAKYKKDQTVVVVGKLKYVNGEPRLIV